MKALLDTHFVVWVVSASSRLKEFEWLDTYRPYRVSPISILEIAYLGEVGRLEVKFPQFDDTLRQDPRFVVDDLQVDRLASRAHAMSWTRDPFDRLLAAHSLARNLPLCTVDQQIRKNFSNLVPELPRVATS